MSLIKCIRCEGQKVIKTLGSMIKSCPICKGFGRIEKEELNKVTDLSDKRLEIKGNARKTN